MLSGTHLKQVHLQHNVIGDLVSILLYKTMLFLFKLLPSSVEDEMEH